MRNAQFVICHTEHEIDVTGPNAGAEMATRHLARFLAKAGERISVIGCIKGGDQCHDGVQYIDVGKGYDIRTGLQRVSENGPYHLITAGRAIPIFVAQADSNCLSKVLITHDRAGNDTGIKPHALCKNVDKVICVSNAQRDVFLEAGADPEKTITIHNGVDLEIFKENPAENRDLKKLVFAGALIQDKGIHLLIPVFAKLRAKYPDVTLDVYGSASLWGRPPMFDEQQVEAQIPGIKFHGKVPQHTISEAFQSAGVCVIPSIWFDPFPLTALEAQVTGCPAVAFDVGGLREGIKHEETGVMLTDISEDSLYHCLDQLLSNPQELKRMSDNARQSARAYFNWERVASEIVEIAKQASGQASSKDLAKPSAHIALLSEWDQRSDHSLHAAYLREQLPENAIAILSPFDSDGEDDAIPCWSVEDFSQVTNQVKELSAHTLHINIPLHKVNLRAVGEMLSEVRKSGTQIVLSLLESLAPSEDASALFSHCDSIIVPNECCKLETLTHGCNANKIKILPLPISGDRLTSEIDKAEIRRQHSFPEQRHLILLFGDVLPVNEVEAALEAQVILKKNDTESHVVIVGDCNLSNPEVVEYKGNLDKVVTEFGLIHNVEFRTRPSRGSLEEWLQVADLVIFNPQHKNHGMSFVAHMALGAGALVATSIAPQFSSLNGAVWRITSGYPPGLSAHLLLTQLDLRSSILEKASALKEKYGWASYSKALYEITALEADTVLSNVLEPPKSTNSSPMELIKQAEIAMQAKDYAGAHALFESAIQMDQKSARAWRGRGATYISEGNFDQALVCLEQAHQCDADDIKTLCGLGFCHTRLGNLKEAKPFLVETLTRDLSLESSLIQLLEVSYALEEFDDLIEVLYKFVAEYPDSMDMRYCLAAALFKQGNCSDAETMLDEILVRLPEHQGAQELLKELGIAKQAHLKETSSRLKPELSSADGQSEKAKSPDATPSIAVATTRSDKNS